MTHPLKQFLKQSLSPREVFDPSRDSLVEIVAHNWTLSKDYLCQFLHEDKAVFYNVLHLFSSLHSRKGLSLTDQEAQDLYSRLLKKGRIEDLASISSELALPPSPEQLTSVWTKFFEGDWNGYRLDSLERHLGPPPLIQAHLDTIANDVLAIWAGEKKGSGREMIQPKDIQALRRRTKKTPQWDTALAHKAYHKWLAYHLHEGLLQFLQDTLHVQPDPEKVQQYYQDLLSGKRCFTSPERVDFILEELERAITTLKIPPQKELLERFYADYITSEHFESFKKAARRTKVPLSHQCIQQAYGRLLRNGQTSQINLLRNQAHVPPHFEESSIQEAYRHLLEEGNIDAALSVYLLTQQDPLVEEAVVTNACQKIIADCEAPVKRDYPFDHHTLDEFVWLYRHFPLQSEVPFKGYISRLIAQDKFHTARTLLRALDLKASIEDQFLLAFGEGDYKTAKKIYALHQDTLKDTPYGKIVDHLP